MPRSVLRFVFGVSLLLLSGGCLTRVPVTFHVTDADTGEPIASAHVKAMTSPANLDEDLATTLTGQSGHDEGRTGPDGRIGLDVPSGRLPVRVSVRAEGYMTGSTGFPQHWARSVSTRPVLREIALYPLPLGKAVVVLPDGFRGPLRIVSRGRADYAPGKRVFEVSADIDGTTAIPFFYPVLSGGSSVARRLEARFASSRDVLPEQDHFSPGAAGRAATPPDVVAFRLVAMNDVRSIFVVGTADDAAKFKSRNGLIIAHPDWTAAFDRIFPKLTGERIIGDVAD